MGLRRWRVWVWGVLAWLAGCAGGGSSEDLASALRREPALSTFVAVVQASGLEPALAQAQGVTVFAPTDSAFEAWWTQAGTSRAELLADPARAAAFVRGHLVDRALGRAELPTGRAITTRSGVVFKVENVAPEGLVATDGQQGRARVLDGSLPVAQGFVHVVDAVLRPPKHTVLQAVQDEPTTAWLAEALVVAGLAPALEGPDRMTLFAPTQEAWQAHMASIGQTWAGLSNQPQRLRQILAYHVLQGSFLRAELPVGTPMTMLEGGQVSLDRAGVLTDECRCPARIVAADRFATNGVVHRIDRVMLRNP